MLPVTPDINVRKEQQMCRNHERIAINFSLKSAHGLPPARPPAGDAKNAASAAACLMAGAGGGDTAKHCVSSSITVGGAGSQASLDRTSEWICTGTGIKGPHLHPRGRSAFNLAGKAAVVRNGAAAAHIRYLDTNTAAIYR